MCYTDCFNQPEKIKQELSTEDALRILHEMHAAGVMELVFTGGDPLARPDFLTIYEEAFRLGFLVAVFTNGTLFTPRILESWRQHPPQRVEISIHGITSNTFDRVTGIPGSWERCKAGVLQIQELNIPLVLKTVILSLNQSEILHIKKWAESLGPGVISRMDSSLRDDLSGDLHPKQFEVSVQDLDGIMGQDPVLREAWLAPHNAGKSKCAGGDTTFHIDAYGVMQRCTSNRRGGYDLRNGNFLDGFEKALPTFPCPKR